MREYSIQNNRPIVRLAEIRRQNGIWTPFADLIHDVNEGYPPFRTPALRAAEAISEIIDCFRPAEICVEPRNGRVCTSFQ